ncbi:hypothetical protein CRUP_034254 [Coryphaenoides rupestris]|nr:hypothetical protein CRUP_034254 [Coryphaenoides rupestris]
MPGVLDRMELRKVPTQADDDDSGKQPGRHVPGEGQFTAEVDDDDDRESHKFLANGMMDKKRKYEEEYHPGHTSFGMSVFNLSNAIMGSGILGLSFAMANTGILLFSILLVGVAILSLYSVHLLLMTSKEGGSLIYEKLGERAFGWPGKMAAFVSITLQNIGAMSSYLFIVKYELPQVIRSFMGLEEISGEWYLNGNYLVVIVTIAVILPLSLLKNLGYLGYTSGFSLSCMVFFVCVLIYKKSHLPCPLPFFYGPASNRSANASLGPLALHNASRRTPSPSWRSRSSATRRCCPSTASSRKNVEAELLHTFTKVYTFDTMLLLVRVAVLTAVTLTVPIVLFPIRSSINTLLFSGRGFSWFRHLVIAAVILLFNNLLVIFVPTIRDIFGFIGSSAATMLIFILPAAFYLRLVKSIPLRRRRRSGYEYTTDTHERHTHTHTHDTHTRHTTHTHTQDNKACQSILNSLPLSSPPQAFVFLIVGVVFMIGSLTLIVMDWIHNPPGSGGH